MVSPSGFRPPRRRASRSPPRPASASPRPPAASRCRARPRSLRGSSRRAARSPIPPAPGSSGVARSKGLTNRRFLSLWLPRLSTDLARRAHEIDAGAALAVVATQKNARRLVGGDGQAERLGLTPGLTLADARARQPALVVCDADPAAQA